MAADQKSFLDNSRALRNPFSSSPNSPVSEPILKRIQEVENHPNYRKINEVKTIKQFIQEVMNNKEGPHFLKKQSYPKKDDWKGMPYFIRPCKLFPGHYLITGFYYSYGVKLAKEMNGTRDLKVYISLDNFEIMFRPEEQGYRLCVVIKKKVHPIGNTCFDSLKALLDLLLIDDFEQIINQEIEGTELRVSLAWLIHHQTILIDYFQEQHSIRKELGIKENMQYILSPRKNWIHDIETIDSIKEKVSNKANKTTEADHKSVKENEEDIYYINEEGNIETPNLRSEAESPEQTVQFNHEMFKHYNRAAVLLKNEVSRLLNVNLGYSETLLKDKLADAKSNVELAQLIFNGFTEYLYTVTIMQYIESQHYQGLQGEMSAQIAQQQVFETTNQAKKERDLTLCPCCDDINDQKQASDFSSQDKQGQNLFQNPGVSSAKTITLDEYRKYVAAADKAESEYQVYKQNFVQYLSLHRENLLKLSKKFIESAEAAKKAKIFSELQLKARASRSDIHQANTEVLRVNKIFTESIHAMQQPLTDYFDEAKKLGEEWEKYIKIKGEHKAAKALAQKLGIVPNTASHAPAPVQDLHGVGATKGVSDNILKPGSKNIIMSIDKVSKTKDKSPIKFELYEEDSLKNNKDNSSTQNNQLSIINTNASETAQKTMFLLMELYSQNKNLFNSMNEKNSQAKKTNKERQLP